LAASPARTRTFTRAGKGAGYSAGTELRAALTNAPAGAILTISGRARHRHQGPNSDGLAVSDKLEAEAAGLAAFRKRRGKCGEGFACGAAYLDRKAFEAAAACAECSTTSFACSGRRRALVAVPG